jgi:hypothetical protein
VNDVMDEDAGVDVVNNNYARASKNEINGSELEGNSSEYGNKIRNSPGVSGHN